MVIDDSSTLIAMFYRNLAIHKMSNEDVSDDGVADKACPDSA
jgi:hypothetical protein